MKEKTRTWPTGVIGAIRIIMNGMNVKTSLNVLRIACTSLFFSVDPESKNH